MIAVDRQQRRRSGVVSEAGRLLGVEELVEVEWEVRVCRNESEKETISFLFFIKVIGVISRDVTIIPLKTHVQPPSYGNFAHQIFSNLCSIIQSAPIFLNMCT